MRLALPIAACLALTGCTESSTKLPPGSFAIHAVAEGGNLTPHWDPAEEAEALEATAAITDADVEKIEEGTDEFTGMPQFVVHFTASGATAFSDFTAAHVDQKIAIVVDGRVVSAPIVVERIPGGRAMFSVMPSQRPALRAALGFD